MRKLMVLGLAGPALLGVAPGASAATSLGDTSPGIIVPCVAGTVSVQVSTSGRINTYTVPDEGGVITSWSVRMSNEVGLVAMRLYTANANGTFTAIAQSAPAMPTANTVTSFPTRITAPGGSLLALYDLQIAGCYRDSGAADRMVQGAAQAVGTAHTFGTDGAFRTPIGAVLEPDADHDGFGDESQDGCPTNPASQADCVAPAAPSIGSGPKARTSSTKAKLTFSGEAGASFECRLDKGRFKACTAPTRYKGLKAGKHTFAVRATDAAGNTSEVAKRSWRVSA
jgi:hypothetical protein